MEFVLLGVTKNELNLKVRYTRVENVWKYVIVIRGNDMLVSSRTFLTVDEARIEAEWTCGKLGFEFTN